MNNNKYNSKNLYSIMSPTSQASETQTETMELSETNQNECLPFEGCEKRLCIYFENKNEVDCETIHFDFFDNFESKMKAIDKSIKESQCEIGNLRSISSSCWSLLLEQAKCSVLSVKTNDHFDAYLLSESSLFVYKKKMIIKTCGRTTLLHMLPYLLQDCCYNLYLFPYFVVYSRSNFMFPDYQRGIYRKFDNEVNYLNEHFKGFSIVLGPLSNVECHGRWNVYVAGKPKLRHEKIAPKKRKKKKHENYHSSLIHNNCNNNNHNSNNSNNNIINNNHSSSNNNSNNNNNNTNEIESDDCHKSRNNESDDNSNIKDIGNNSNISNNSNNSINSINDTNSSKNRIIVNEDKKVIEILMFDVCESAMKYFWQKYYTSSDGSDTLDVSSLSNMSSMSNTSNIASIANISSMCGISDTLPKGTKLDSYLFDPCGYSVNGLLNDKYWTIHVTPESHGSFISFETNHVYPATYYFLINKLVKLFKPQRFSLSITTMDYKFVRFNGKNGQKMKEQANNIRQNRWKRDNIINWDFNNFERKNHSKYDFSNHFYICWANYEYKSKNNLSPLLSPKSMMDCVLKYNNDRNNSDNNDCKYDPSVTVSSLEYCDESDCKMDNVLLFDKCDETKEQKLFDLSCSALKELENVKKYINGGENCTDLDAVIGDLRYKLNQIMAKDD